MSDRATVEAQLGRPVRASSDVVVRCHLGLPVVIEVPPFLDVKRVGRIESVGGVRRMEARAEADPAFGARLEAAHDRTRRQRDATIASPRQDAPQPTGGIGGSQAGVKCLHAHYADHAAGHDNPVGEVVAPWVEPLDCVVPCVVDGERNPAWREP